MVWILNFTGLSGPKPLAVQEFDGLRLVVWRADRGVVGVVFRGLQRVDLDAVAGQEPVDDGLLVNGVGGGHPHVGVGHHLDVVEENHPDVADRRGDACQRAALQPVVFLIGHFQRDVGVAALHLGHPGGGVGDELDCHGVELGLAAPIVGVGLQTDEGVPLELFHHVGAGADGGGLEALGADLFVIGLGQDVAGEEIHPLEDRRVELGDVGNDLVALDPVVNSVPQTNWIGLPVSGFAAGQ